MGLSTTFTLKFNGDAVKKGLKGIGTSIKSLSSAAMGIAKAGAAVVAFGVGAAAGIAAVALKLNSIGEDAKAADERLKNITKSMGLFGYKSDDVTDRLLDFADAQERATGTDAIVQTQAKLMTFKELAKSADLMGGAFDRATMAAVDMAGAGFGTAEMNAVQLGKALNDPIKGINSLTKSGITFTAAEKDKIAMLVKSNQTLKAQDIILKSIETQVGGTAAATATASGKMKASMTQVVEAFAIPFSEGFNAIPGMLENVFPKIKAKAGEMGVLFGTALSEAVNGDFERFVMIGEIAGTAIGAGLKIGFMEVWQSIANVMNQRKNWITGEVHPDDLRQQDSDRKYLRDSYIEEAMETMRNQYRASQAFVSRVEQNQAQATPTATNSSPPLVPGGTRAIQILESIDRRLAPQP